MQLGPSPKNQAREKSRVPLIQYETSQKNEITSTLDC